MSTPSSVTIATSSDILHNRTRILTLVDWYIPAYKAGGPIRSVSYMVARLSDEFAFHILTGDRDLQDETPFPGITLNQWQTVGNAHVAYLSPNQQGFAGWRKWVNETPHDILYLNSLLSTRFTILPMLVRLLGQFPDKPVVLAPRGMFSPGFLALKSFKRCNYIRVARTIGLFKNITWQASSQYEEEDIRRWFGTKARVIVAPNVPRPVGQSGNRPLLEKRPGSLRIVFLSRLAPKKNLDGALELLLGLTGDITFEIYGPREDMEYWAVCQAIIDRLPKNITVNYCGQVPNEQVEDIMSRYHLFLFPTHGENFGHVILESLNAGCPVIVSDQTPWRNLEEARAGYDIPLAEKGRFVEVVKQFIAMDEDGFRVWQRGAVAHGNKYSQNEDVVNQNRLLFRQALAGLKG